MFPKNLKFVALPIPEIIAIGRLGGGLLVTPNLGEAEAVGGRDGTVRFPSIFARFRDIAAFVLQHATLSHPTSSLPQISSCSPGSR